MTKKSTDPLTEGASSNHGGWELLEDKPLGDFGVFEARVSYRKNPRSGTVIDFMLMSGLDWVNVIALTPDKQVVLVRQYRHASEEFTLELPGGCIDKGEAPIDAIRRELLEETCYAAGELHYLGKLRPNPALISNYCHYFYASDVKLVDGTDLHLDPGEDISVVLKPMDQIERMILEGELPHALHVAAFNLLKIHGLL